MVVYKPTIHNYGNKRAVYTNQTFSANKDKFDFFRKYYGELQSK
jgi:hypothetical protein